ncbi:helix-turn-helix domain-containing protein [Kocuria sp. M4R2S49]|uniref:AraC family transcriptional regulator n=1 Tax=Kocuria rhizosphaericola TaxID=3376284 RepID=UPI0037B8E202
MVFVVPTEVVLMSAPAAGTASAVPGDVPGPARSPEAPPAGESPAGTSRRRFHTCDVAEGLEILEEVYNARELRVVPDTPFTLTQAVTPLDHVHLERARLTGAPAAATIDATGTIRVAQVLDGRLAFTDATRTVPGPTPFLLPQRPYSCRWTDLDLGTVAFDASAVAAHAAGLLGLEDFSLRFTGARPVDAGMAHYWSRTVAHVSRDLLADEQTMAVPLLRGEAFRNLATAMLHTFPSTFLEPRDAPAPDRAGPAGVRRAVAFMEEHLAEDIDLARIAAAAGMSPRGLQAAFRRARGSTPLGHLRELRLEAVHADLVAADPCTGATVGAIAARWGFAHPGRLAAAYRERYGRSPATTLRA